MLKDKNNRHKVNEFFNTGLDATLEDRYCRHCHIKLVHNPKNRIHDKYIYSCPRCNCTTNVHDTEPNEKIRLTFPSSNPETRTSNKPSTVIQAPKERLSRSEYFIQKTTNEKHELEDNDPYLALLKRTNLKITNIDYRDPNDE